MTFKDPLYEEVHRRLMAQNKLDHRLTKRILDKLVCAYEIPEGVVISKSAASVAEAFGFYEVAMGGSGVSNKNYDKYKFTGVEVGNVTFGMLIPTAPNASGQLNLYIEVPTTIRSRGLLLTAQNTMPTEVSGRSTEGDWAKIAEGWEGFATDHFFRIRFEYKDNGEAFYTHDDGEYERIALHSDAFLCMPGTMAQDRMERIQDWLSTHDRHDLSRIVVETFMESAPRLELVFEPHPVVIENSDEQQNAVRMQRNLERLVNVLRIFPRD